MAQISRFELLGADILTLICEVLHSEIDFYCTSGHYPLLSLNKTSKFCHAIAFPILCRKVVLYNDPSDIINMKLFDSLLNNELALRLHVHECGIYDHSRDDEPVQGLPLTTWLKVFGNLANLKSLDWYTDVFITGEMFSQLEATHPLLQMKVNVPWTSAIGSKPLRLINNILISSPLITSLDATVAWSRNLSVHGGQFPIWFKTELDQLALFIQRTPTLRQLDLSVKINGDDPGDPTDESFTKYFPRGNLLHKERKFPPNCHFENLCKIQTQQILDKEHNHYFPNANPEITRMMLRYIADWVTIRSVRLFHASAILPFDESIGRCPDLREIQLNLYDCRDYSHKTYSSAVAFVGSLNCLEIANIFVHSDKVDGIFHALCSSSQTLRELKIRCMLTEDILDETPHPSLQARELQEMASWNRLEKLTINISAEDIQLLRLPEKVDQQSASLNQEIPRIHAIAKLTNLRQLCLHVTATKPSDYLVDSFPPTPNATAGRSYSAVWMMKIEEGKDTAIALWRMFHAQERCNLQQLRLLFSYRSKGGIEEVMIRWSDLDLPSSPEVRGMDWVELVQKEWHVLRDGSRFFVCWSEQTKEIMKERLIILEQQKLEAQRQSSRVPRLLRHAQGLFRRRHQP